MEPILQAQFNQFKKSYAIDNVVSDLNDNIKESKSFEYFINHTLLSADYPDIFIGNFDLLDCISVGGGNDTGIDGVGIKINGRLIGSTDDIDTIVEGCNKINIEFVFIQAKMQDSIDSGELTTFCQGVIHFLKDHPTLPENEKIKHWRNMKDYLYSKEEFIVKWNENPTVKIYYATSSNNDASEHFTGIMNLYKQEMEKMYFSLSDFRLITGREIIRYYKEGTNSLTVNMYVNDIIPLTTNMHEQIKKAYIFTCSAKEFMKILANQDGSLRRALFNDNVRDYLGNKGGVNSEMETTIENAPEMFLLCNNGITIVCSNFEQIKDKLVKLDNPQIVNGCQTSNSIYKFKNNDSIDKVQLIVRVISTDDINISNKIVRGTNKQNQVLDEAFETTKPFHQYLEEYFVALEHTPKIYYERRAKQYSNDPLIPKTNIVNLRVITQAFVSMFIGAPHEGHRHESKLLDKYCITDAKMFQENHDASVYYICALVWYIFEQAFRDKRIHSKYKSYKAHLYFIFINIIGMPKSLSKSKTLDKYLENIFKYTDIDSFYKMLPQITSVFDHAVSVWISRGRSKFAYKENKDFTTILKEQMHKTTEIKEESPINLKETGHIVYVGTSNKGLYAFIKPDNSKYNDIYCNNKEFKSEIRELIPGAKVVFKVQENNGILRAIDVHMQD